MLLTAGGTLAFYAYSIYMQKFLVNTSGFSRETASRDQRDQPCSASCCSSRWPAPCRTGSGASR